MPFPIQPTIIFTRFFGPLMRWNNRFSSLSNDPLDKVIRRIASVGNDMLTGVALQQLLGLGNVMALTGCQDEAQRIPQSVHGDMDFRAETPSTTSQRLALLIATFFGHLPRTDGHARWYYPP